MTFGPKLPEQRMLFFDIENRPLSYWYDGNPTAEITLISWKFDDQYKPYTSSLAISSDPEFLLSPFVAAYDAADVVCGHNIRQHDLPLINAALIENGLPQLKPKLTIDTLRDLSRWKDIPKSLEYLADLLGAPQQKFHMTQHSWRIANRLQDTKLAKKRVETDVLVTEWVYNELKERKMLTKPPRMWKP